MQKIFLSSLFILLAWTPGVFAIDPTPNPTASDKVSVETSEYIPGSNCKCKGDAKEDGQCAASVPVEARKYTCQVSKGLGSFQSLIATIVRWFVNIVTLLGVLAIVGAGVMMMFGSDSEEYTKKAKGWAKNIIIGLVILFTFRYILQFLAPWIFQ